jgi:hypothetical protein
LPAAFAFYLVLNIISWQFQFFWDSLLTSTICSEFKNNGFNYGIPPNHLDAGHPPLFYGYLYLWWSAIESSLMVSHFAMLPFLWVMVYQFLKICEKLLANSEQVVMAVLLFCLETTILAQSTLVSYDIVLLAFYLLGLRYLLEDKKHYVAFAGIVLCLISLRGVVAFGALFLTEFLLFPERRKIKHWLLAYSPALVLFALWNLFHYQQTGWALFSTSEQWAAQRGFTGVAGIFKNGMVIIRNLLEPGRLLLYFFIAFGLILNYKKLDKIALKNILWVVVIPLITFSLFFIPFNNPIGHRYLLIVFALSIPLLLLVTAPFAFKKGIIILVSLCLVSGHFWYSIYPPQISKGWDASLAFVPYFKVKQKTLDFLLQANIPIDSTAAHFPVDVSLAQSHLWSDTLKPQTFEADSARYVLVSNINNDFTAQELKMFSDSCPLLQEVKSWGVKMQVFDCNNK